MIKSPASEAARRIRQFILNHRLEPGDHLPTHDVLSQHLEIGRLPLREGLSILRHQGLIKTRNKAGTIVCKPNIKNLGEPISWHLDGVGYEFEDLVLARACLESGAAAEAAERRTARDLLKILDALERLEACTSLPNDLPEEESFHLAILEATHNPVITTFGQLIQLQIQGVDLAKGTFKRHEESNKEHRAIYKAIDRKDREAARSLMYSHITVQL
ncbi:MAG: FadR family transcriptional regulator [Pirellulales bacterium]|nr:FadR family transcriptional regulator [Pirellulales bacterium]